MSDKLQMILTKDEINRIKAKVKNGHTELTVDLHKLTVKEAQRLLKNIIAIDRDCPEIHVIHGFNRGTAIRDMIANDLESPRIISKTVRKKNPGLTDIKLAA